MANTIIRLRTVMQRTGLSRSSIYLRIAQGRFPRPVSLGGRAVGWIDAEVEAWITARIEESRNPTARDAACSTLEHPIRKPKEEVVPSNR